MTKIAICSGCDSNYFPLLKEMIHSVQRFKEAEAIDICIMNTGLTSEQVTELQVLGAKVHAPDWPCDLPQSKIKGKDYLKSCVCRPFLNKYFKGYDVYLWLDADAWVQNWFGVEMFVQGALRNQGLAIAPQVDRCYPKAVRVKWLLGWPWKVRNFYYRNAQKGFNSKIARQMLDKHVLNVGVFALHGKAPHWQRWQDLILQALKKGPIFTAEQTTLGMIVHLEGYAAEMMPAYAHYLCEHDLLWDEDKEQFVEPFIPHHPIGVMHISGHDEMRLDPSITIQFDTVQGNKVDKSLRYLS